MTRSQHGFLILACCNCLLTRLAESQHVRSILTINAASDKDQHGCQPFFPKQTDHVSVLVFDLVLFKGQWDKGIKDGRCQYFFCYRNCYFPNPLVSFYGTDEKNQAQSSSSLNFGFLHRNSDGTTKVEGILQHAQFLSGCVFSGKWYRNNLSVGSLFCFHRHFCLVGNSSNHKWLQGQVTYVDCNTGSSFTEEWQPLPSDDVVKGVWCMGCNRNEPGNALGAR